MKLSFGTSFDVLYLSISLKQKWKHAGHLVVFNLYIKKKFLILASIGFAYKFDKFIA